MRKLLTVMDAKGVGKIVNVPPPIDPGDMANKAYVDAQSADARMGTMYIASYGDATPSLVYELPANQAIADISIEVTEPWDGVGAYLQLGVNGSFDHFFDPTETELTSVATFSKDFSDTGPLQVVLTLHPGSSPTTGKVRVQISTTSAGT
jgi:hypothetical protein